MQTDNFLPEGTILKNKKYQIKRGLAQGGFGITYLAYNLKNNTKIVIKEYYKKEWHTRETTTSYVSKNPAIGEIEAKFRKKFAKEANTIMRLNHPNIVKVYDFFEENGTLYYSMEYIDGWSLSDYVKKVGELPEKKVLPIIRTVANTLGYIHSQNELHLDITPRNIMMTKDGNIKLIDFGVSKHYTEEGKQTTDSPIAHSDGYAPKEQYINEGLIKFSPATDIYALAATMYFMLTATTPPKAHDRQEYLEEGQELLEIPSSLSENVRNAILKGMSISRKDRLQNTEDFIRTLFGKCDEKYQDEGNHDFEDTVEAIVVDVEKPHINRKRGTINKQKKTIKPNNKKENKTNISTDKTIIVNESLIDLTHYFKSYLGFTLLIIFSAFMGIFYHKNDIAITSVCITSTLFATMRFHSKIKDDNVLAWLGTLLVGIILYFIAFFCCCLCFSFIRRLLGDFYDDEYYNFLYLVLTMLISIKLLDILIEILKTKGVTTDVSEISIKEKTSIKKKRFCIIIGIISVIYLVVAYIIWCSYNGIARIFLECNLSTFIIYIGLGVYSWKKYNRPII